MLKLNYNVPFQVVENLKENLDFLIQGIAINATITGNNHKFLPEELKLSAETLNGVPLLVDHKNEVGAIKGRVLLGSYNEESSRIDFKAKVVDNDIKRMVKEGLINSVSVGASVREIEEEEGILIPRGITFKELSLVAVPADSGATFTTALQEAYNTIKEQEMEKCPECKKMIPKDKMKEHMSKHKEEMEDSQSPKEETLQSMKGGIKMSEIVKETETKIAEKIDLTPIMEMLKGIQEENKSLRTELTKLSENKVRAEVKEDANEVIVGKHKFMFENFGGKGAFTLVR